eukprot:scaffold11589_cov27-Tisochrysis_lutea.AAC.2
MSPCSFGERPPHTISSCCSSCSSTNSRVPIYLPPSHKKVEAQKTGKQAYRARAPSIFSLPGTTGWALQRDCCRYGAELLLAHSTGNTCILVLPLSPFRGRKRACVGITTFW